jgi:hypothetical protein
VAEISVEVTMPESITISNLDEATANWIEREAKRRGANKEAVALNLIRKGIECEREHVAFQTYDDLDSLAGTWSEEQATEFMNATSYFAQVDEKLWQ